MAKRPVSKRPRRPAAGAVAGRRNGALPTNGRERLIEAAMALAARHGSVAKVGVRELAREAGLNPNTLYRHFEDVADLGLAAIETVLPPLRQGLRGLRGDAASVGQATSRTLRYFFEFVERNPEAITFAARELHGASPKLRAALAEAVRGLTQDVLEAVNSNQWVPVRDASELADTIVKQMFALALEYVAHPRADEREAIVQRAERFVLVLFVGSYLCSTMKLTLDSPFLAEALGALPPGSAPKLVVPRGAAP